LVSAGAPEGYGVPTPQVTPVVLLCYGTGIVYYIIYYDTGVVYYIMTGVFVIYYNTGVCTILWQRCLYYIMTEVFVLYYDKYKHLCYNILQTPLS
jgi:hypothetical protein